MKSLFKKRIVDERMELQSLRNARKSWNFLLLATGFCLLAELHLLRWELKYIVPQAVVVLAASVYNLFLDARDGNIYTAENANRKKLFLLYFISSARSITLSKLPSILILPSATATCGISLPLKIFSMLVSEPDTIAS